MQWHLEPTRETTHGAFGRDIPPALTVDPGDTVTFRTLDAAWCLEPVILGRPKDQTPKLTPRNPDWTGHCLTGPVAIRGAKPGMVLEVQINEILIGSWGWCSAGGWPHNNHKRLGFDTGEEVFHLYSLDRANMTGTNQHGHTVKLRPFLGVMGMPDAQLGEHSTGPPRRTGGNLDCKELVAGTTLYLPIEVDGGIFSLGDGHAVQGDGEVCVTAIECPMERVSVTFNLRDDLDLKMPMAKTKDSWLTLGLHEDLQEATYLAIEGMLDLMGREYPAIPRRDAYALASLAVDMRITQIANGVQGVHAVLPFAAISTRS